MTNLKTKFLNHLKSMPILHSFPMQQSDLVIVERFKSLVSRKVKVCEIRMFGSRARGKAQEESDLDVLVVVNFQNHEIEKYISDCAWEAGFAEDVIVMPIIIAEDLLKNTPIKESIFIKNVYREGVLV